MTESGEGSGSDELTQVGAGFEFIGQAGQKVGHWRHLHETHERFERAEVEDLGRIGCESGSEGKFAGDAASNGGDQHSAADIGKEFTASFGSIHFFLRR